jgi:hypothetical protein
VPILSLEADAPGKLDERSKIRLESFVEMLRLKKSAGLHPSQINTSLF